MVGPKKDASLTNTIPILKTQWLKHLIKPQPGLSLSQFFSMFPSDLTIELDLIKWHFGLSESYWATFLAGVFGDILM